MGQRVPKWHEEALNKGIDFIVLVYSKAEGFVFCPSNLEKPFRVGGDYDGNWPVTASGALYHFNGFFNSGYRDKVEWFIKYVKMVENHQDFSLSELQINKRNLRVIQGDWPW